jgi:hypothetical protein
MNINQRKHRPSEPVQQSDLTSASASATEASISSNSGSIQPLEFASSFARDFAAAHFFDHATETIRMRALTIVRMGRRVDIPRALESTLRREIAAKYAVETAKQLYLIRTTRDVVNTIERASARAILALNLDTSFRIWLDRELAVFFLPVLPPEQRASVPVTRLSRRARRRQTAYVRSFADVCGNLTRSVCDSADCEFSLH